MTYNSAFKSTSGSMAIYTNSNLPAFQVVQKGSGDYFCVIEDYYYKNNDYQTNGFFATPYAVSIGQDKVLYSGLNLGAYSDLWMHGSLQGNSNSILWTNQSLSTSPISINGSAVAGNEYLAFSTGDSATGGSERMRIDSSGNVGINVTSPVYNLHVSGTSYSDGIGIKKYQVNLTADAQVVTVGSSSYIELTSNSTIAGARTFTLTNGAYSGQLLILLLTGSTTTVVADLVDGGNLRLSAAWSGTGDDTISLIWTGTFWHELYRSTN